MVNNNFPQLCIGQFQPERYVCCTAFLAVTFCVSVWYPISEISSCQAPAGSTVNGESAIGPVMALFEVPLITTVTDAAI